MTRDWVVITGASSGIGDELARIFAKNGINLVLAARDGGRLASLANKLEQDHNVKTLIYAGDLSDLEGVQGLVHAVEGAKIRVKYLVNNAGFGLHGDFTDTPLAIEQNMIDLNIRAVTYLTKVFARSMKKRGFGRILNVASTAAFFSGPRMAVYYASKAYVLHFSEAVNAELRGTGVSVTTLCPGPTETKFVKTAKAHKTRLFTQNLSSAEAVANYGYRTMQKGKPVAIFGWQNKLLIWSARFAPRKFLTWIVSKSHD